MKSSNIRLYLDKDNDGNNQAFAIFNGTGRITFANTWDNGDMVTITWNEAYNTAPVVVYSNVSSVNGSGVNLLEIDGYHSSTSGSSLEASGTCVGSLNYIVVESI